jgi:hypothetical protein
LLRAAVNAGLDADGQAITQCVDLPDHRQRITAPAHDVQHRAKNFLLHVRNDGLDLKGIGWYQVCYILSSSCA